MAKPKTKFVCSDCGYSQVKWSGKCPECFTWNTMEETSTTLASVSRSFNSNIISDLSQITLTKSQRVSSGFFELDRVLGGGVVNSSVVLVGGEPGIGKSTLFLKVIDNLASQSKKVLYVSAEESASQIKMRADRLSIQSHDIKLVCETELDQIMGAIDTLRPDYVIIDSIQTIYNTKLPSLPGNVSQVKECSLALTRYAKKSNCAIFIIGHVTKEGAIAGPRVLEHIVDTVLYFEGEKHGMLRIVRAVKNRFGSTNEIGIFEMKQEGMVEVLNPSGILLGEMNDKTAGSCVYCAIEGTRPVLIEIQALVSTSALAVPRRVANGADYNRVNMIVAVLEKKLGLKLYNQDIYVNIAGGIKIIDPSADLAIACAIVSSFRSKPCSKHSIIVGEVGLTGEVRSILMPAKRINEAEKLGFDQIILPKKNIIDGCKISQRGVTDIWQALEIII
jgi:DNA repair protein RadA/Sms